MLIANDQKLLPPAKEIKLLPPAKPVIVRNYIAIDGHPYETIRECLERQFPNKSFSELPDSFDKAVKAYTDFFVKTLKRER